MPLNGLRSIKPRSGDYPHLEVLDLSYNNLSQEDLLTLGLLPNVKVLHLTGNGLSTLPPNLAMPKYDEVRLDIHPSCYVCNNSHYLWGVLYLY